MLPVIGGNRRLVRSPAPDTGLPPAKTASPSISGKVRCHQIASGDVARCLLGRARLAGLGLADPPRAADRLLVEGRPLAWVLVRRLHRAGRVRGEQVGANLLRQTFGPLVDPAAAHDL